MLTRYEKHFDGEMVEDKNGEWIDFYEAKDYVNTLLEIMGKNNIEIKWWDEIKRVKEAFNES